MDKQEIIDEAKRIGVAKFAETMPEYCGVISKKPTIKAVLAHVEAEEAKLSTDLIERVLNTVVIEDIRKIQTDADADIQQVQHADLRCCCGYDRLRYTHPKNKSKSL